VVQITFLRRLLGLNGVRHGVELPVEVAPPPVERPVPVPVTGVACPNCGVLLDPPPSHTRLCPRCRRRIVVRRSEGRAIYLTEASVEVFEALRRREIEDGSTSRERRRWLHLAQLAGVPSERRQRVEAAPLTAASVKAARSLYMNAAERAVKTARRRKRWDDVARIRRRQAAALYEEAGSKPPPPADIVALHQEGVAATLRALQAVSREAELVGASCCATCRADNGRIFRITDELQTPRLPHQDCPHGLCSCDWWPVLLNTVAPPRRRRTSSGSRAGAAARPAVIQPRADRAKAAADAAADAG
jgi:hypothetical protein